MNGRPQRNNKALAALDPANPPSIKAHKRNHYTGEIVLQFTSVEVANKAKQEAENWLPILNPGLKLKHRIHTIMLHAHI